MIAGKHLEDRLAVLEQDLDLLSNKLQREGQRIPNMTHPSVPMGSEECATIRKLVGSQCQFSFPVKDHVELGLALDLFDFEATADVWVSGNKFYYLKNEAVLLEMALINWTLSQLQEDEEVQTSKASWKGKLRTISMPTLLQSLQYKAFQPI